MQISRPAPERFDEALALLRDADVAVYGDSDWTREELQEEWENLDLEQDAWLIELDGRLDNPTGAVRLYEHAGMRVLWRADVWQKELRP